LIIIIKTIITTAEVISTIEPLIYRVGAEVEKEHIEETIIKKVIITTLDMKTTIGEVAVGTIARVVPRLKDAQIAVRIRLIGVIIIVIITKVIMRVDLTGAKAEKGTVEIVVDIIIIHIITRGLKVEA